MESENAHDSGQVCDHPGLSYGSGPTGYPRTFPGRTAEMTQKPELASPNAPLEEDILFRTNPFEGQRLVQGFG